jgi:S1-C subfamily serine protease
MWEVATKNLICFLLVLPFTAFSQTALTTAQIARKVSPSVVVIEGKTDSGDVLGSGFVISKDGKIVTNLHVIREMKAATVELANSKVFDSFSILATDERRDLAIIKIAGFGLPVLDLGDSDALVVGEPVVVVGSPRGLEGTVTAGILSSVRDSGDGYKVLQTDAAVNPGNSGGPLVNNRGQAIGVVSFILRSSQGLNFGIPINYVRELLNTFHEPMSLERMRRNLVNTTPEIMKEVPQEDELHYVMLIRQATNSCQVAAADETIQRLAARLKEHTYLGGIEVSSLVVASISGSLFDPGVRCRSSVALGRSWTGDYHMCGQRVFSSFDDEDQCKPELQQARYGFSVSTHSVLEGSKSYQTETIHYRVAFPLDIIDTLRAGQKVSFTGKVTGIDITGMGTGTLEQTIWVVADRLTP